MRLSEIFMSPVTVERAEPSDAVAVAALLDAAAVWQQSRGIEQWRPGLFGDEVRLTIAGGYLFVARCDRALVGCFMLDVESPEWIARWFVEQGRPAEGAFDPLIVQNRIEMSFYAPQGVHSDPERKRYVPSEGFMPEEAIGMAGEGAAEMRGLEDLLREEGLTIVHP